MSWLFLGNNSNAEFFSRKKAQKAQKGDHPESRYAGLYFAPFAPLCGKLDRMGLELNNAGWPQERTKVAKSFKQAWPDRMKSSEAAPDFRLSSLRRIQVRRVKPTV